MTRGNLDFSRTVLDMFCCGCSSSGSFDRFPIRSYGVMGSSKGAFVGRKLHCPRRDSALHCVFTTKTSETLFNGNT